MPRQKPTFSAEEAVLKKILDYPDPRIFWTKHAIKRMFERAITEPDVTCVLKSGSITEIDFLKGVTVSVVGADLDGRRIKVVAELQEERLQIKVVTVMPVKRKAGT